MDFVSPFRPFQTHGGANIPDHKITSRFPSVTMPAPKQVIIPMLQHLGEPCTVLVREGDHVFRGQKIGDSDALISAPVHASVSGTVTAIKPLMLPGGNSSDAVVIESDGFMESSPDLTPPIISNAKDFTAAIRESGLVGLGGAGFPAHVKLTLSPNRKIDTLIINAAECEPYVTSDHREALENPRAVIDGVYIIIRMLRIHRIILAVEDNKPDVIKALADVLDHTEQDSNDEIRILSLKSHYPQGAEKVLVQACTNRYVPPGKLPFDVGCLVMNIASVAFISNYLKTGMPLVARRVTISGTVVASPKNVIIPIGTKIREVIQFCGGYTAEPKKIIMGGPMMGVAVANDTLPILKQNNAILAFGEHDAALPQPTACIRCGRCVTGCPMLLIPTMLEKFAEQQDVEQLEDYNVSVCIECGTCSFNCPANRRLVQSIRLGKNMARAAAVKKKGEGGA